MYAQPSLSYINLCKSWHGQNALLVSNYKLEEPCKPLAFPSRVSFFCANLRSGIKFDCHACMVLKKEITITAFIQYSFYNHFLAHWTLTCFSHILHWIEQISVSIFITVIIAFIYILQVPVLWLDNLYMWVCMLNVLKIEEEIYAHCEWPVIVTSGPSG